MANDLEAGIAADVALVEEQAFRLWAFVHKRFPRFTREQALHVVQAVIPRLEEELRPLARRIQAALELQRAKMPYATVLQAASRMLKGEDWHQARQGELLYTLKLPSWDGAADEHFVDWHTAGQRLVSICEQWMQSHPDCHTFRVETNPVALVVWAVTLGKAWSDGEAIPVAIINSLNGDDRWLTGVTAALEVLRRRLEETHLAILDGYEVLNWCDKRAKPWSGFTSTDARDARNAELVLMREDDPAIPDGFEIARGDELACWSQMAVALEPSSHEVIVDELGGWVFRDSRYVWHVVLLEPGTFAPGVVSHQLGTADATRLLRRYRVLKATVGSDPKYRPGRKRLDYLGGPAESYRPNLKKLTAAFDQIGLSWAKYCADVGEPERASAGELPLEFVLPMLAKLAPDNPGRLFALPARSELVRCDDDVLLRALLPRVDHVSYRVTERVGPEQLNVVREAIDELSTSVLMRLGLFQRDEPLPDLVYGNDGAELLAKLQEFGLVAYAGVTPHFRRMPKEDALLPHAYPYAFGHSLVLDIDLM